MTVALAIAEALVLALVTGLARLACLVPLLSNNSDSVGSIRMTSWQVGRRWVQSRVTHSILEGTYGYPPFVYWVVSRFPRAWWTPLRYAINYGADVATALVVWAAVRWGGAPVAPGTALVAGLAVGLNPMLLPAVEHARLTAPNARSLGLLLNTVWIGLAGWAMVGGSLVATVLLVPLAWLVVLTSQFGMQTMVGLAALLSLVRLDGRPVGALVVALAIAWVVPPLGVRTVLEHKLAHWRWYPRVQRTIGNVVSDRGRPLRTRWAAMWALARRPIANGQALGTALQMSPPWKVLAGVLPLVAVLPPVLAAGTLGTALADPSTRYLAQVVGAAGVLCVATLTPRLLFLGEAERYVEHALAAVIALAVALAITLPDAGLAWLVVGATAGLAVVVAQLAHRQWPAVRGALAYPRVGFDEERALLRALVALGRPVRVATVPVKAAFLLHDLLLDERQPGAERIAFYFQFVLGTPGDHFAYMLEDTTDGYVYLHGDLARLRAKYGIDVLIIDTAMLADATNRQPIVEALRQRTPLHRGRLSAYALQDAASPSAPAPVSAAGSAAPAPVPAAAPGAAPLDIPATIAQVQRAVGEGRVADAVAGLERLAAADPANPTWRALLAQLAPTQRAA